MGESMHLDDLIRHGATRPLNDAVVDSACRAARMTRFEIFDAFARRVADGYSKKEFSWGDCDMAMTNLFSFAYTVSGDGLSDHAWLVYHAFDEAEYRPGGEDLTAELLSKLK